jgi:hypothetical protein
MPLISNFILDAPLDGVLPMNHHPVLERKTISHGFVLITLDETEVSRSYHPSTVNHMLCFTLGISD